MLTITHEHALGSSTVTTTAYRVSDRDHVARFVCSVTAEIDDTVAQTASMNAAIILDRYDCSAVQLWGRLTAYEVVPSEPEDVLWTETDPSPRMQSILDDARRYQGD